VTNTRITHATPSALYAHSPSRYWEDDGKVPIPSRKSCKDIARQLVEDDPGRFINVSYSIDIIVIFHYLSSLLIKIVCRGLWRLIQDVILHDDNCITTSFNGVTDIFNGGGGLIEIIYIYICIIYYII